MCSGVKGIVFVGKEASVYVDLQQYHRPYFSFWQPWEFMKSTHSPLIFHWRDATGPLSKVGVWLTFAIAVVIIAVYLWSFSIPWSSWPWKAIWQRFLDSPGKFVGLSLLYSTIPLVTSVVVVLRKRYARLTLDDRWLSYNCGLPILSKWLDWTLDLDAVRSEQLKLGLAPNPAGSYALSLYTLTWRDTQENRGVRARQLRPANWRFLDQPVVRPAFLADFALRGSE